MHAPSGYSNQAYAFPPSSSLSEQVNFQSPTYGHPPSDPNNAWAYSAAPVERGAALPPPALPSIHTFSRSATSGSGIETEVWHQNNSVREDTDIVAYRPWHPDASYPPADSSNPHIFGSSPIDPSPTGSHSSGSDAREATWLSRSVPPTGDVVHQDRYPEESFSALSTTTQLDGSMYPSSYPQNPSPASYYPGTYVQNTSSTHLSPSTMLPSSRQSFTRTLVGPLSSNACRLLDENRKPGIFFLFQDLSVRTEGLSPSIYASVSPDSSLRRNIPPEIAFDECWSVRSNPMITF